MEIKTLLEAMSNSPWRLKELVQSVPEEMRKQHRLPGKWSIHEHACHLAVVDDMVTKRLDQFIQEEHPVFQPYIPGQCDDDVNLLELDLDKSLERFENERPQLIQKFSSLTNEQWSKPADHPEYFEYTPYIMVRHIWLHDHFHMYRIEELILTKEL